MYKVKYFYIFGVHISLGMAARFGIGFSIDSYGFNIDLLCFWLNIER
jgi:hypothetical protein